jgi:hypothetical protein
MYDCVIYNIDNIYTTTEDDAYKRSSNATLCGYDIKTVL